MKSDHVGSEIKKMEMEVQKNICWLWESESLAVQPAELSKGRHTGVHVESYGRRGSGERGARKVCQNRRTGCL